MTELRASNFSKRGIRCEAKRQNKTVAAMMTQLKDSVYLEISMSKVKETEKRSNRSSYHVVLEELQLKQEIVSNAQHTPEPKIRELFVVQITVRQIKF